MVYEGIFGATYANVQQNDIIEWCQGMEQKTFIQQ
jgi:hypothetical protein